MATSGNMRSRDLVISTPASPLISTQGGLWVKQFPSAGQDLDQLPQQAHHHVHAPMAQEDRHDTRSHQRTLSQQHQQQQHHHHHHHQQQQQPHAQLLTADAFVVVDAQLNSSSSDLASPLTPTFSYHGSAHKRYASSASSIDLQQSFSPAFTESPVSPAQPCQTTTATASASASPVLNTSASKRQLPDVQEDPLERDVDYEPTMTRLTSRQLEGLYDCLCDSPCIHQNSDMMVHSADWTQTVDNEMNHFDYDMGFLSDGDADSGLHGYKPRTSVDSPLAGLTVRLGSRFPTLSRWRSTKRRNRAFTAVSEPCIDVPPPLSRATSTSRSSSLSAPSRKFYDRTNEPPLPPTPALSFYEYQSTDSIASAVAIDIDRPEVRESIERERDLAHTPLLPPLLTESSSTTSVHFAQQPPPLQSPSVAPATMTSTPEFQSPPAFSTPSLRSKPSISSFRPPLLTSMSSPIVGMSEVVVSIPNLLEQHDAWSDRLGHANYTILPRPYFAETTDLETLRILRADWDLARTNYTKHMVRTGEHYGTTSKTYALTEAKWAETEREWRVAHDALLGRIAALKIATPDQLRWERLQDDTVATVTVPNMLDADGKFPDLGDEDIVGPMERDAVMARDLGPDGDHSTKKFWKSLAGKVGLRK